MPAAEQAFEEFLEWPRYESRAAKYLAELARRGASEHTLRNYGSDLEQFAAYFEPPGETAPAMEQLDLALLREWLAELYDQGLSAVSVRRKLAAVRAMFKFLLAGRLAAGESRRALANAQRRSRGCRT